MEQNSYYHPAKKQHKTFCSITKRKAIVVNEYEKLAESYSI